MDPELTVLTSTAAATVVKLLATAAMGAGYGRGRWVVAAGASGAC